MNEELSQQTEGSAEPEKKSSFLGDLMDIIESIFTSVFVVLLVFAFVCRPVTVDGGSMNPTLTDGDRLVMFSAFYTPKAGDIVIINNAHSYTFADQSETSLVEGAGIPTGKQDGSVKRIIKRVIATGGQEIDIDFVNGIVTVDGEALSESYIMDATHLDEGAFDYPVTVPEGYVFVMGDNRNNSADSRDSRVGFVKEEDIIGKAVLRVMPFDSFGVVN